MRYTIFLAKADGRNLFITQYKSFYRFGRNKFNTLKEVKSYIVKKNKVVQFYDW